MLYWGVGFSIWYAWRRHIIWKILFYWPDVNGKKLDKYNRFNYTITHKEEKLMKTKIQVQFGTNGVDVKDIEKAVKEDLKAKEVVLNKLDTLDIYFKPAENAVYYVATDKAGKEIKNDDAISF
ncbi:MAG: DUF6465 family protein [Sharpea porci]|uniref:DUF6465 family protein n=1 Tax=Sharpea porci TaxID=2652286 RepID=UPI0024099890|nr:DUF6465 family protein [Sharpea porci]MDD6710636.1 DUF6465 family protein [Sharpea porci]